MEAYSQRIGSAQAYSCSSGLTDGRGEVGSMGKNSTNIQVHVTEVERGNHLSLDDEEGEFLSIESSEPVSPSVENPRIWGQCHRK